MIFRQAAFLEDDMELWDLYTENRELTGRTHIRDEKLPEGLFHIVVHVWIRNSRGEYLISRRAASRPMFPQMWESVGGAVTAGESSLEAALREAREEVGVELDPERGVLVRSVLRRSFGNFCDAWLFEYDGEIDLAQATTDEADRAEWASALRIRQMMDERSFVPTLAYFVELEALGAL